ncbi:MAG: hypothetical protein ACI9FU_000958, partial [Granulosicoccus sp.]
KRLVYLIRVEVKEPCFNQYRLIQDVRFPSQVIIDLCPIQINNWRGPL